MSESAPHLACVWQKIPLCLTRGVGGHHAASSFFSTVGRKSIFRLLFVAQNVTHDNTASPPNLFSSLILVLTNP
jgi:hypothetical protein